MDGASDRSRTCNLLIRSQKLYPIELRMHTGNQIALLWFELPGFSSNSLLCMRFWRLTKAVFYSAKTSGVFVGHLRVLEGRRKIAMQLSRPLSSLQGTSDNRSDFPKRDTSSRST